MTTITASGTTSMCLLSVGGQEVEEAAAKWGIEEEGQERSKGKIRKKEKEKEEAK